jgi:hypothetical protein
MDALLAKSYTLDASLEQELITITFQLQNGETTTPIVLPFSLAQELIKELNPTMERFSSIDLL